VDGMEDHLLGDGIESKYPPGRNHGAGSPSP
jgi:hypothetical protein